MRWWRLRLPRHQQALMSHFHTVYPCAGPHLLSLISYLLLSPAAYSCTDTQPGSATCYNHDHHGTVAQNVDHATTRRFGQASSLMHTIDNTSAPSTLIHTIDSIPASGNLIYITKISPAPNTAHALTANKHAIMTQMKMAFVKIAVKQLLLSQLLLSQLLLKRNRRIA